MMVETPMTSLPIICRDDSQMGLLEDIRPLMLPCRGLRPIHRRLNFRKTVVANLLGAFVAMLSTTSYVDCVRMIYRDPSGSLLHTIAAFYS
eukprot:scaffold158437_cov20-Prasinocladus_malaysianus.AAC.1